MIKANELRIGNLIEKGGEWFIADFITIQMAHNYNSIPITPEILEKCGAKAYENNLNLINEDFNGVGFQIRDGKIFGYATIFAGSDFVSCPIEVKYLHQLQNLYFALTGIELEIKDYVANLD